MTIVSVVIPVYRDWQKVADVLGALEDQSLGKEDFEVVVVNNEQDESVSGELALPENCRIVWEPRPGSYVARNTGVRQSVGELVVFTDADCIPQRRWLSSIVSAYKKDNKKLIAGGITVRPHVEEAPNVFEAHDMALGLRQQRYVRHGFAATANLAVPRVVFDELGGFDENRLSGGDAEFSRRAVSRGFSLTYVGAAAVDHPARNSWRMLRLKAQRVTGGGLLHGRPYDRLKYFIRVCVPPVPSLLRIAQSDRIGTKLKMKVSMVQTALWFVTVREAVMLLCRKEPERK